MLVRANELNPDVAVFPAWERAGGLTLAKLNAEHSLVEAATASWWTGTPRSAWVVLTRAGLDITAALDGKSLPNLDTDRVGGLRSAWGTAAGRDGWGIPQQVALRGLHQMSPLADAELRFPVQPVDA